MTARSDLRWMLLAILAVALFFWKIVFTTQYSLILDYENANQSYAWTQFAASNLQHGHVPLWDPNVQAGRSFIGEMESGLFYPPKLLLYFWPLNRDGLLSPRLVDLFFVLDHMLAAVFMFLLARSMGLSGFSALVTGLCFSLGGFAGHVTWLRYDDGLIWLPMIFLFLRRAILAPAIRPALRDAFLAGLGIGLVILAGCLHLAMMDAIVVASAAGFAAARGTAGWKRCALVVLVAGLAAFFTGAVQLLPSFEYGPRVVRWLGSSIHPVLSGMQKLPYNEIQDGYSPRALFSYLLGFPFAGDMGTPELSPYMGLLPAILSVVGFWKCWREPWVRFFAGLALCSFLYTLGLYSLLHGVTYALAPFLWMAREPGRFIYLAHFAMALAAGFGTQVLLAGREELAPLVRVLRWGVLGVTAVLSVPALLGKPDVNEWAYMSWLILVGSAGLIAYMVHAKPGAMARFLLISVILFDLNAFTWTIHTKSEDSHNGVNQLETLLSARPMAKFFEAQPGPFRVQFAELWMPNIGDVYGLHTTGGHVATSLRELVPFLERKDAAELLNVRYIIQTSKAGRGKTVYEDAHWKVYENPSAKSHAWMEPAQPAVVRFVEYSGDRIIMDVWTEQAGALVLSEVDYPGWSVTVNGQNRPSLKMHGLLRGVEIPAKSSRVVWRYRSNLVIAGTTMTALAFAAAALLAVLVFK